jgi:hypothetical protein
MDKERNRGRQFYCQGCGKKLPITIDELRGELHARIRCKFCKSWNELRLKDIPESN